MSKRAEREIRQNVERNRQTLETLGRRQSDQQRREANEAAQRQVEQEQQSS